MWKARYVPTSWTCNSFRLKSRQAEEKQGGRKGRLLGIITLSDVLRYIVGEVGIGEGIEPSEDGVDEDN